MRRTVFLFFLLIFLNVYSKIDILNSQDFKVIISSQNMKEKKDERMDINTVTVEEMLSRGIASSYVTKITEYREITGGFEKLDELKRIKGIREATYSKLSKSFKIIKKPERNFLYINTVNDEVLKYYGFSKKEIKEIRKFIQKYGRIVNNIELKELISKSMYESLKDKIRYEENTKKWEG
ncbi:MAG: helix-hairpin-helix domain-containing protein [Fusobacterium sp.]|uniref:ComEA family DNA-binding protein n=1 Tax=Fusobacterium sp. TaxID=68766 RepID=UPI0026DD5DEA|nr:helix-hairpin-helix domain-containing protein [Fusobacterium sp.]MDO4689684.1 helix-hairpin-helix domain-containing protein [Fusobacterium sp.]